MNSDTVIRAEGLSKRYLVGHRISREPYQSLRETLARYSGNGLRKTIDLVRRRRITRSDEIEEFWALKDISFEVKRGDVLGVIGRNGAGKSTLLKILSRITEPTGGRVTVKGRIASLLEVGTGFHPELTGRENIFLNGAILGMSRAEVKRKFDEIVAFAEVEKFLDTPVKRYSSGMYVRLAFAVAAHLEPEILVVDEVLAVGDAEFQKKCLGKMSEVAGGGRTILFVSHNIGAVESLCNRCLGLEHGRVFQEGTPAEVLRSYLANSKVALNETDLSGIGPRTGAGRVQFARMTLSNNGTIMTPKAGQPLDIRVEFCGPDRDRLPARVGITFLTSLGAPLFYLSTEVIKDTMAYIGAGDFLVCRIPRLPITAGRYKLNLFLERAGVIEDWIRDQLDIDIEDGSFYGTSRNVPLGLEATSVLVEHVWLTEPPANAVRRARTDAVDADP